MPKLKLPTGARFRAMAFQGQSSRISPPRRALPPLAQVLDKMEWVTAASGGKVGYVKHFLKELKLKNQHSGEKAGTWNKLLRAAGHTGRLQQTRLANRPGRAPWVGSKDVFRALWPLV